ncbi:protein of unknown function [Legionella fallonii LLAP-10]|uniref:Uncharacterized protein n=1 Tax=Legionella fallonii LLAP-10 TaxID=1212491 RepID=A0A098G8V8_9GAMM|nr:protein of unknown function [Legionella fallonii LLAP-10]
MKTSKHREKQVHSYLFDDYRRNPLFGNGNATEEPESNSSTIETVDINLI